MAKNDSFIVRYFSDGTYDAYLNPRVRSDAPTEQGLESDPVYGHLLEGAPIKGSWDSSDGFFHQEKDGHRTYIGTVSFDPPTADGTPGGWEGGGLGREGVNEDGSRFAVGSALFRGMAYIGTPGGRIKAITGTCPHGSKR